MIEVAAGYHAIRADRLIDGLAGPARPDVTVVLDGQRIAAVVEDGAALPAELVVERVPGTLVPGFVDPHLHLAFSEADAPRLSREAALALATRHAEELLLGGVTTARDLGVPHGVSREVRERVTAGAAHGPRLLVAIQPVTRADGHCHWFGRHAGDRDAIRREVGRLAAEGADVIKVMVTGGMSTPGSRPGVPQYATAEVRAAVETAHAAGLRVAAHVLGSAGVRVAIDAGVDTLEHGWTVTGGDQQFDPAMVPDIAASGIVASVTAHEKPRQLLPGELTPTGDLAELRRRLTPHRVVAAAGVPFMVHSDCGPYHTRYDRFGLSIRVFHEGMGVPVERAIAAATSVPAKALGLGDSVGAVAPGRRADLVLLDGDPTRDPGALTRVVRVLLGGRVAVEAGRLV
ncbi:MAG: amidohydrolase family protein [Chloroflexota bacterium]